MIQEQDLSTQLSISSGLAQYSRENGFVKYYDIKHFVKRYSTTIAVSAVLGLLLAGIYILSAVPLYTAHTQIIIDPSLPQTLREPSSEGIFALDSAQVESQLEVLKSEKIAGTVIKQLRLEEVPEFSGRSSTFVHPTDSATDDLARHRSALAYFQSNLSVRRVGLAYSIDILFNSESPVLAARIANAAADAYIAEQIEARAQATRLSGQWLEQRIDHLRKQMNQAALDAQESRSRRDYRINSRGGTNEANAASDGSGQKTMEELDSTAQTYRRIYESYLMAYTEAVQKQSYPVTNARIITAATPPLRKSYPKTQLIFAFGGLMGYLAGLGIAFFRHKIDRSVWGPQQIREEAGVECLASIPSLARPTSHSQFAETILRNAGVSRILKALGAQRPVAVGPEALNAPSDRDDDPLKTAITLPFSGFSLGIKRLKTAISMAGKTRQIRCIGILSALPNEGKTTVAASLGLLFAASGARTLLVDCDLRNASLSRSWAPKARLGLLDVISGTATIDQCIIRANETGPDLLPMSNSEEAGHSDDVLGSDKVQLAIDDLKKDYDFIIVDMPPLSANLDGLTMSSTLDCALLTATWGKTPLPVLSETIYLLRNARVEILGVALTKVDVSTSQYGSLASSYLSYAQAALSGRLVRRLAHIERAAEENNPQVH